MIYDWKDVCSKIHATSHLICDERWLRLILHYTISMLDYGEGFIRCSLLLPLTSRDIYIHFTLSSKYETMIARERNFDASPTSATRYSLLKLTATAIVVCNTRDRRLDSSVNVCIAFK